MTKRLDPKEISKLRIGIKEYVDLKISNIEKNVDTANSTLNIRLEAMNEFRSALTDQSRNFVGKTELNVWKEKIEEELQRLRDFKLIMDSKASSKSITIAYVVLAINLFISMIGFIFVISDRLFVK